MDKQSRVEEDRRPRGETAQEFAKYGEEDPYLRPLFQRESKYDYVGGRAVSPDGEPVGP